MTRERRSHHAPREFIAIDGEAVTENGRHTYVLLAASDGSMIRKPEGLSTWDCLRFLFDLKHRHPNAILVGFATDYDVNMITDSLEDTWIRQLWEYGSILVRHEYETVRIDYTPSKAFRIALPSFKLSLTIYNVFGFFQKSFVRTLESWGIGQSETIARMKKERGSFRLSQLDEITAYCLEECRLLVELMTKLDEALRAARLTPQRWDGAGAAAAALLKREAVKPHIAPIETYPDAVQDAIMRAYYGGRVEVYHLGMFEDAYSYDIRSAYPSVARELPTSIGTWQHTTRFKPSERWALWRVEWRDIPAVGVTPFPYRQPDRRIVYPTAGTGWYYTREVAAARALYPSRIVVKEGWVFQPVSSIKPFGFLDDVYAERRQAKHEGHPKEKVLKLAMNSVYGKLAQGIGYGNKPPVFRSFFLAGLITSETRAKLLTAALHDKYTIIQFATDGIISKHPLPHLDTSDVLGGWEADTVKTIFVAQPGIYRITREDRRLENVPISFEDRREDDIGHVENKSRGFFAREIDFPDLVSGWERLGPKYVQRKPHTRFYGMGIAVLRNDMAIRNRWLEEVRLLSLHPSRKHVPQDFMDEHNEFRRNTDGTIARDEQGIPIIDRFTAPNVPLLNTYGKIGELSAAYRPKDHGTLDVDEAQEDLIAGFEQPVMTLDTTGG